MFYELFLRTSKYVIYSTLFVSLIFYICISNNLGILIA